MHLVVSLDRYCLVDLVVCLNRSCMMHFVMSLDRSCMVDLIVCLYRNNMMNIVVPGEESFFLSMLLNMLFNFLDSLCLFLDGLFDLFRFDNLNWNGSNCGNMVLNCSHRRVSLVNQVSVAMGIDAIVSRVVRSDDVMMIDVHVAMWASVVVVMMSSCAVRSDMRSIVMSVKISMVAQVGGVHCEVGIRDGLLDDNFLVYLVNWLHDLYRSISSMDGALAIRIQAVVSIEVLVHDVVMVHIEIAVRALVEVSMTRSVSVMATMDHFSRPVVLIDELATLVGMRVKVPQEGIVGVAAKQNIRLVVLVVNHVMVGVDIAVRALRVLDRVSGVLGSHYCS